MVVFMRTTFGLLFSLLLASGGLQAQERQVPQAPEGSRVFRNLAYVENGHERQKLDLYLPAEKGTFPLVIWIHGGAWRQGSKEFCPGLFLVKDGFAVASVNYRL